MIKFDNEEGDYNPRNLSNSNHNNPASRGSSGFKNPRIVRVSRDFGGKDRHSKVWTVKGLKDRRIRLSIPTAIELYDLQDKLGLSQPSKVIDWLLDVTKEDIDKLPPLQMALEDFNRFHLPSSTVHQDFNASSQLSFPPFFNSSPHYDHHHQRTKGKETSAVENYKSNSCNYNEFQPSYNLSLSRFSHQLDSTTYAPLSSQYSEPQLVNSCLSCTPSISSSSLCPPYFMHNNHFQLLNSNSTNEQAKVLFGLNMNSKASSERDE